MTPFQKSLSDFWGIFAAQSPLSFEYFDPKVFADLLCSSSDCLPALACSVFVAFDLAGCLRLPADIVFSAILFFDPPGFLALGVGNVVPWTPLGPASWLCHAAAAPGDGPPAPASSPST